MAIKYTFETYTYKDGESDLVLIMDDPEHELLARFLLVDLPKGLLLVTISKVKSVMTHELPFVDVETSVCSVRVENNKTYIYDKFLGQKTDYVCTLKTHEFYEMLNVWYNKLAEHDFEK